MKLSSEEALKMLEEERIKTSNNFISKGNGFVS